MAEQVKESALTASSQRCEAEVSGESPCVSHCCVRSPKFRFKDSRVTIANVVLPTFDGGYSVHQMHAGLHVGGGGKSQFLTRHNASVFLLFTPRQGVAGSSQLARAADLRRKRCQTKRGADTLGVVEGRPEKNARSWGRCRRSVGVAVVPRPRSRWLPSPIDGNRGLKGKEGGSVWTGLSSKEDSSCCSPSRTILQFKLQQKANVCAGRPLSLFLFIPTSLLPVNEVCKKGF